MQPLIWPALLLLLGIFFIFLELFIPSGGLLGVLAGASVLASIYVGFTGGMWFGMAALLMSLVAVPIFLAIVIHFWPRTPIGRLIFLRRPDDDEILPDEDHQRQSLVGKFGVAKSKMLPSVDGRTYDAVSRGNPIEVGDTIRVVSVKGNRIVVASADPQQAARAAETSANDVLEQPIDSLGLESFDEPLA
jgi:membrane-bound ClpP family serine protease